MAELTSDTPKKIQNSKFKIQNWSFWLLPALPLTLLALRFGMRLLGVRPDIPFPGFVYSITAPIVTPFYSFFPASERFDYYATEWAALLAAGCILTTVLLLYVAALLIYTLIKSNKKQPRPTSDPQT